MYPQEPGFIWHLRTVSLTSVINFLLPARLGELSIVVLVAKRLALGLGDVGLSIFAIRVQELVVALIIGLALLIFAPSGVSTFFGFFEASPALWSLVLLAFGGVIVLAAIYFYRKHPILDSARKHFCSVKIWGCSWLISVLMYLLIYAIARWLNVDDALAVTPLIFLAVLLVSFVPVNGLANIGGYHLAWVLPLVAVGYETELAVSIALLAHLGVSVLVILATVAVLVLDMIDLRSDES